MFSIQCHLKLCTQILLVCIVFSTIISSIAFVTILATGQIINNTLKEASNNIFEKQTLAFLNNNIWAYKRRTEELIEITRHQITQIRTLNKFVLRRQAQNNSIHIERPKMCLLDFQDFDSYCYSNSMCCGVFGSPLDDILESQLASVRTTVSLMNMLRLEFDFTINSQTLIAFNSKAQYFCISWGSRYPVSFRPMQRSYYIDHLNQMINSTNPEQQYFANPFITVSRTIRSTMTTSLLDLDNQFLGIISKDLDFGYSQFNNQNSFTNISIYVFVENGQVIFTSKYNTTNQPIFFLNQSEYSGFNQEDFEQIMLQYNGKPFQSNCNNFDSYQILCRHNTYLDNNFIVQTSGIPNSPFIVLILSNTNYLKNLENHHLLMINNQLNDIVLQKLIIIILSFLGITITSQLLGVIILRQLNCLIEKMQVKIHTNNIFWIKPLKKIQNLEIQLNKQQQRLIMSFFSKDNNLINSDSVTKLINSISNLYHLLKRENEKKCEECIFQECLFYPRTNKFDQRFFRLIANYKCLPNLKRILRHNEVIQIVKITNHYQH